MNYNPDLPKFLEVLYLPDHEKIPGYLNIDCISEKIPGQEKESSYTFQYLPGKLYFRCYPTGIQLPLGEVNSVRDATEMAKHFLRRWVGNKLEDSQFRHEIADEISRLEREQRK